MTNTAIPQWVRPLMTSALINIMNRTEYLPINEPRADLIDRKNLDQIAGIYKMKKLGNIEISVRKSKAILKVNKGMEYHMHLVDSKTFYIPGFDPWISFDSLRNNKFQNIRWSSTNLQTTGKRISN